MSSSEVVDGDVSGEDGPLTEDWPDMMGNTRGRSMDETSNSEACRFTESGLRAGFPGEYAHDDFLYIRSTGTTQLPRRIRRDHLR